MADFHFVEDYEHLVDDFVKRYPLDEAMQNAVGGFFNLIGPILAEIVIQSGLKDGMSLVDIGCGCGRAAKFISERVNIEYLGIDIVQRLLDYAATVSPAHYRFKRHRELSIPAGDTSADMVCAFSLFTHLLHEETYVYLQEAYRILRPGGTVVMSFLEFAEPEHWKVFGPTVENRKINARTHLNMFIERSAIDVWCAHIGFERVGFVDGYEPRWNGAALGQAVAVLRKKA